MSDGCWLIFQKDDVWIFLIINIFSESRKYRFCFFLISVSMKLHRGVRILLVSLGVLLAKSFVHMRELRKCT